MTSRLDRLWAYTQAMLWVPYNSTGGDNDHNGTQDRAEPQGGEDCSGFMWDNFRNAWLPDPPPFPLSSTAGYAFLAHGEGWIVPIGEARSGDLLIHDRENDAYASNGPRGHGGILKDVAGGWWLTAECASSNGVDWYTRRPSFWCMAIRVPGLVDHSAPVITAAQLEAILRWLEEMNMEHGMAKGAACAAGDRIVQVDAWGGLHTSNGVRLVGGGSWPGKSVARNVILRPECLVSKTAPLSGWLQDLDGALHPFAQEGTPLPPKRNAGYWAGGKILDFNEIGP